jgi:hypothetical protein
VRLQAENGTEVPFAIREGRPHWKARLTAPVAAPRAEDLIVFSASLPHDAWTQIDVVAGSQRKASALSERDGQIIVSYPGLEVTVAAATGTLTRIVAFGESVLDDPLSLRFWKGAAPRGKKQLLDQPHAELVAKSSTAGMTELHFVIKFDERLSMALSYRVHANGLVEVLLDERPWHGVTPWLDHAGEIRLSLRGPGESLPYLVNRAPFYGFEDFASVVQHAAAVRRLPKASVLELGEETTNGRRWNRRLFFLPSDRDPNAITELAEAVDKGAVVDVLPVGMVLPAKKLKIAHSSEASIAAQHLGEALTKRGLDAELVTSDTAADSAVVLQRVAPQDAPGIEGDGFEIQPNPQGGGVVIRACTRFGLMQAALRTAEYLAKPAANVQIPLVASNPAVQLRAGGFGGSPNEVDFPYGSEEEWQKVTQGMLASGMNVMTDLGMWSNWKMPVSYRYMPELKSTVPGAHDEVSGAPLSQIDAHREHAQRLLRFLHDRGVKVWLWLPVGCVPTTYAEAHPEAVHNGAPCFTDPLYNHYLEAFLKELLETYAIDGIVMIRDDNGGRCDCDRCKKYVDGSVTKSAVWEQFLIVHRWLRSQGFPGDVAVYPYYDSYEPRLDPRLPADLYVLGHGSGTGMLARDYERIGPMGDTWLDNLFLGFRPPTTARMRRLLADRGAFWIGGAYCGAELPWEAIGYFGWEPTATVNSFRYQWSMRDFGAEHALAALKLLDTYEKLWEFNDLSMFPGNWVTLAAGRRQEITAQASKSLGEFRQQLAALRAGVDSTRLEPWFCQVALFGTFFEFHLQRLDSLARMRDLVVANKQVLNSAEGLPQPIRQELLDLHQKTQAMAKIYVQDATAMPGGMFAATKQSDGLRLFHENDNFGYKFCDDVGMAFKPFKGVLAIKQFAGTIAVSMEELQAGQPFTLRIELRNCGIYPWQADCGPSLQLHGDVQRLGLPEKCEIGAPMVFGDRRTIEVKGQAPKEPGETQLQILLSSPYPGTPPLVQKDINLHWK